jgi:DNA-binding winged helix-turn-helix (wHTH) protein/Tol biopolymer transport system component
MSSPANGLYEFGPYRLDAAQRLLTRSEEGIVLAPKTFDLLLILVESRGRVLTKKELMDALWPDTFVDEANLPFQVSALRKALGEEGAEWIDTLPKQGYRFTAAVKKVEEGVEALEDARARWTLGRLAPWLIAAVTSLVAMVLAVVHFGSAPPPERTVRLFVSPPENVALSDLALPALSPDGDRLVFGGVEPDGGTRLWIRPLASLTAEPVKGTEGAISVFWSPDSRSAGFFAGGKLKRIDLAGGSPQTLCDASDALRPVGTWSRAGVILFNSNDRRGLHRVAVTGGEVSPVTTLDSSREETSHLWPQFLPDGRHFLYFVQSARPENTGVYVGSLDSKESKRAVSARGNPAFARLPSGSGYLLFMQGTTLMGQRYDAARLETQGESFPAIEQVWLPPAPAQGYAAFSASANGVLAYQTAGSRATELVWLDRQGKRLGTVGEPAEYSNPALSGDGRKLVVCRRDPQIGTRDLWLFDLERATSSRFTFDPGTESNPAWSPDSSRIAFHADPKGSYGIYVKAASGVGETETLLESRQNTVLNDWSADGRYILYLSQGGQWALPLQGQRNPIGPLRLGGSAQISPNARWVAYTSDQEVHVQSFPPSGSQWQISTKGGLEPHWSRDGKELFYVAGNRLMAVDVKTDASVFQFGTPKALFEVRLEVENRHTRYQVAANGQRFLVNVPLETYSPSPITVVTNWTAGLKR